MSQKLDDAFYEGLKGPTPPPSPTVEPEAKIIELSTSTKPVTSRNLFSYPETHPVVLDMALLKKFGVDWFPWQADTLFQEIEREFKTPIAEVNRIKLMAVKTLHIVDSFWDHWEVFEKVTAGLNGTVPQVEVMQPPDLPSLFVAISIANAVRKESFGDEVKRYCAAIFLQENVHYAPEPLSFCQEYISQPIYICKDCDQQGSALPPFSGYCPSCSQMFEQDKALSLKPDPESPNKGDHLDYRLTYESQPTKKRFEELNKMPAETLPDALKESPEDIESARLIVALDYMHYREKQANEQLVNLGAWLGES